MGFGRSSRRSATYDYCPARGSSCVSGYYGAAAFLALAAALALVGFVLLRRERPLDDCTFAKKPSGRATSVTTEFNGWSWTCVYTVRGREIRQRGPTLWTYAERVVR